MSVFIGAVWYLPPYVSTAYRVEGVLFTEFHCYFGNIDCVEPFIAQLHDAGYHVCVDARSSCQGITCISYSLIPPLDKPKICQVESGNPFGRPDQPTQLGANVSQTF